MVTKKIFSLLIVLSFLLPAYSQHNGKHDKKHKNTIAKQAKLLRKKHSIFLSLSPFKTSLGLNNEQRKAMGLPPNKYFEQEWELTMNPSIGRPTRENLELVRNELERERNLALAAGRTPGDASDNQWVERGPNNVGGRTRAILFDPNDATYNTVFAGGVSGGLWKNTNISSSSSTWTKINSFPENLNISKIIADPNNSQILYIGTGESYTSGDSVGNGVWKSTNAGATWTKILGTSGNSTQQTIQNLTVNSPASIAGSYPSVMSLYFGNTISSPITANVVLVNDGSAPTTDACATASAGATFAAGSMTGKIALIRGGTCAYAYKVKAVQDAGAIAAIVMNYVDGVGPMIMGGSDATITIPSISISKEDGDKLETAIAAGTVNVTLNPNPVSQFTGVINPGVQFVNDMVIKNNSGVSELFVAVGDTRYRDSGIINYIGSNDTGLYKTTNGGGSWTALNLPPSPTGNKTCPNNVEIATNGNIWVSSTDSASYKDGGGRVFLSTDGGTTFQLKYTVTGNGGGRRVEIEASATNANTLYVLSQLKQADASTPDIEVTLLKTTDAFATNPTVLNLPVGDESRETTYGFTGAQAFYDLMIESDPTNDQIIYVGGIDLYRSTNSGSSWTTISNWMSNVHSDQHAMVFKPNNSNIALFGNDGGIFYCGSLSTATASSNTSITDRNSGYNVTQFYSVGVAPTQAVSGLTGDYFAAGAQDNGTQYFAGVGAGINSSVESQGGDGAYTLFDQTADKYYISNYVYNNSVNLTFISTGTSRTINSESGSNGAFISPMALDSSLDILYSDYTSTYGAATIRRYTNIKSGTVGKTNLTNALLTGRPTALTVSKYTTTSTKLFVGTISGKILKITNANGTPSWLDLTANASPIVGSISDIELGASEDQIFVTVHNYGVTSIWYTNNGTATNPTWSSIEGNLPDIPVKCILQNPLNTSELIVGTELGVWFTNTFNPASSSAQSLSWNQSYNGMSNVKVVDMDIQTDSGTPTAYNVYASTYGRGIFSGQFKAAQLSLNLNEVADNSIKIYPTINDGNITVASDKFYGNTMVNVFDLSGRKVFDTKIFINTDKNYLNFGKLSTGEYIIKLSGDGFNVSRKIIIE